MRVLIAGCGYVGTALGLHLCARGDEVHGLRRRADQVSAPLRPLGADLAQPSSLRGLLPEGLDVVVSAAAAPSRDAASYRATYVEGLGNLCRELSGLEQPPRHLVLVSSTGVYGRTRGEWVDEESEPRPASERARILLESEGVLAGASFASTIVRLSGIYGPGRESRIDQVLEGRASRLAPDRFTNRIHLTDVVGALAHVLDLERSQGLYVASDHEPVKQGVFQEWMACRLGRELLESATSGDGESKRCDSSRLRESGYAFTYPTYREGYESLIGVRGL